MNDQLQETKNFIQDLSEQLYLYITKISPAGLDWVFHAFTKLAILVIVFLLIDFLVKPVINLIFRFFHNEEKYPVIKSIYQSRITNSVAHLF
ncbi:MAG TPA: mechanosensitive ion channel protein MscS, partial [Chryseobacterium sp.]|nr:mechanosensitive ion channel protein MscS [Chryseobacterium sp.]